jgi:hypothetical protein
MIPILTILVSPPLHLQNQYSSYLATISFLCYFVLYLYTYTILYSAFEASGYSHVVKHPADVGEEDNHHVDDLILSLNIIYLIN